MPTSATWTDHFNRNMTELGIPTPEGLFDSLTTAIATIGTLEELVRTFGPRVTINELIRAGTLSDKLLVAGGMTASAYIGAAIGSAFVATVRTLTGGLGIEDMWIAIEQWPDSWPDLDLDGYWFNVPVLAPSPAATNALQVTQIELNSSVPIIPPGDPEEHLMQALQFDAEQLDVIVVGQRSDLTSEGPLLLV